MVRPSRKLKIEQGVLPQAPMLSKGKKLSADVKHQIKTYYENDDVSRLSPGKKDNLSVRDENGSKTQVQKRLILSNLREVYIQFKQDDEGIHVGFSTFCSLRPKQCILAGAGGTHCVCVCTYHQNPKLQLNAIGEKGLCLQDVMAKAVCNLDEEECKMRRCKSCPGREGVVNYLRNLPVLEGKVEIRFKTWVTVDRCNLEDKVETAEEFLDSFSTAVVKLLRHHFVSKKQAIFYKKTKNNLELDEGLLAMDFSQNYSSIVQDAAQVTTGKILSVHFIHLFFISKCKTQPLVMKASASLQIPLSIQQQWSIPGFLNLGVANVFSGGRKLFHKISPNALRKY